MRRKQSYEQTDLSGLLGWEPARVVQYPPLPTTRRGRWWRALKSLSVMTAVVSLLMMPLATGVGAASKTFTNYWESLPSQVPDDVLPQPSVILAADGSKIGEFFSENRVVVPLEDVPQTVQDALLSIEDTRFYEHGALDAKGTLRALVNNALGESTQGGSTLTQQYAKNLLLMGARSDEERAALTSQTSYARKVKELRYAAEIEATKSKDEILEGYLNAAYFGEGAYGIGAAAKRYFSKDLDALTIGESALLVGLVQNPTTLNPVQNPTGAVERRDLVLDAMVRTGRLDDALRDKAVQGPLKLRLSTPRNGCVASDYPYFCQYVRQVLANDKVFGATVEERQARLYKGGMTIRTTLDPKKQAAAQKAVDGALGRDNRVAAAVAVITPGSGQITAMAQNRSFGQDKKKNQTEVILPVAEAFQSGSAFKPITLAAAIDGGYNVTAVRNTPSVYFPPGMNAPKGGFKNSTAGAAGPLTAAQALWRSSNTFFVQLQVDTGLFAVRDMAERLGYSKIKGLGKGDASFTLGTKETSPVKLASVYATLAAHGKRCDPTVLTGITTTAGKVKIPPSRCTQAVRAGVADTVANIMRGTIDGPDRIRTGKNQSIGRPAAGKTGTTENNGAVWFAGFTPQNATVVWVGDPRGPKYPLQNFYANGQYIGRGYGGIVAGPIWKRVMSDIHRGVKVRKFQAADPSVTTGYTLQTPDVRGLTVAAATAALQQAGLSVKIDTGDGTSTPDPQSQVTGSKPAAGSKVPGNRVVTLTVTRTSGRTADTTAATGRY